LRYANKEIAVALPKRIRRTALDPYPDMAIWPCVNDACRLVAVFLDVGMLFVRYTSAGIRCGKHTLQIDANQEIGLIAGTGCITT
jgi:hypothetical protein